MVNVHNGYVQALAQFCNRKHGLGEIATGHYVPVDVTLARRIAEAYEKAPSFVNDVLTQACYRALEREVKAQYDFLVHAGFTFEAWTQDGQPYANNNEMCEDVRNNSHLYYFTGGDVHPLLGETNNLFRAVHDVFGHAAEGYQFGPRGEENAWIHHSMMFSPLAQRALTTETRGQNSWVNYGPHSALPVCERPYAEQKVFILVEEFCDWQLALARQS